MQKNQQNNIKEILKPLVRKILLENENFPDEKGSNSHKEEAPISKTAAKGTGDAKVKKIAQQALEKLKGFADDLATGEFPGDIEIEIKDQIIDNILIHNLGSRAYKAAEVLFDNPKFMSIIHGMDQDVSFLFDPEIIKDITDNNIDESLVNEVLKRLGK